MIIFKDILSDDELISDSYNLKEVDGGAIYEADCAMITEGAVDVDIGANASAEEAGEDLDDQAVKVNNILHSFKLSEIPYDLKGYKKHLKTYVGKVKAKLEAKGASPDEIKAFMEGAKSFAGKVQSNFKDYEFYIGESTDPDNGMIVLLNYREDGVTPYVSFWKHGLVGMKV